MTAPRQEVPEAARLARRAVDVGRDEAMALSLAGWVLAYVLGDLDDGADFVDRALGLNPNLAIAWGVSGWMKICFGEHNTAIEHAARAMRLSPLDPLCGRGNLPLLSLISSEVAMTRRAHGRKEACGCSQINCLYYGLPPRAMLWPGGLRKRRSSWRGCANLMRRCAFPISRMS